MFGWQLTVILEKLSAVMLEIEHNAHLEGV
jgi:hypothetical protein